MHKCKCKGAVCGIDLHTDLVVELGIAVQIQNIGEEICCVFCQLATRGAEIQLGKLAVDGFHKPKQRQKFRPGAHIFKGE